MEKTKLSIKKIAIILISILLAIIVITLIRKIIILNFISAKIDDYTQATNYYIRMYLYQGWNATTYEVWVKNGNMVRKTNNELEYIIQNNTVYEVSDNNISETNSNIEDLLSINWNYVKPLKDELPNLKNIFKYSISTAKVNGKNCYKLTDKDNILFFEKSTGLLIRTECLEGLISGYYNEEIQSTLWDYKTEFNSVKDEDVQVDISNFNK